MTRITIFIPITQHSKGHIDYFLRKLADNFGGFTISRYRLRESLFLGGWVNKKQLVKDSIAMLMVDTSKAKRKVKAYLRVLKLEMEQKFKEELVWITTQNIEQIL
jgi:hypothetical protein